MLSLPNSSPTLAPTVVTPGARVPQACNICRSRKVKCSGSINEQACLRCAASGRTCVFEAVPLEDKVASRDRKAQRKLAALKNTIPFKSTPTRSLTLSNALPQRPTYPPPRRRREQTDPMTSPLPIRTRRNALCASNCFQDRPLQPYGSNTGHVYPNYASPYYSLASSASPGNFHPTPELEPRSDPFPLSTQLLSTTLPLTPAFEFESSSFTFSIQRRSVDDTSQDDYLSSSRSSISSNASPSITLLDKSFFYPGMPRLDDHLGLGLYTPGLETLDSAKAGQDQRRGSLVVEEEESRVKRWVQAGGMSANMEEQVEWTSAWCI